MFSTSRRAFLSASLAGLATGPLLSSEILGADATTLATKKGAFNPDTLFLTWQRDPTTTMTVQWIGRLGETADAKIYYAPVPGERLSSFLPFALPSLPGISDDSRGRIGPCDEPNMRARGPEGDENHVRRPL